MMGGNYINPAVLGFPMQISDNGYFGLVCDWNIDGSGNPYVQWLFDDGQYGQLGTYLGYLIFEFSPTSIFEINSSGIYYNGVKIVGTGAAGDFFDITFHNSIIGESVFGTFTLLEVAGGATLSSIAGFNSNGPPTVGLAGTAAGTVDFSQDPNPSGVAFRVTLNLTGGLAAADPVFVITLATSFASVPKAIISPSCEVATEFPIYFDFASSAGSVLFFNAGQGTLPPGTYQWDILLIG